MKFKDNKTFEERVKESKRIEKKYPTKVPIICENNGKTLPNIDRNKFLVPKDLTMAQFMYIIRKRINLDSDKSIFLLINNNLVPTSQLISKVYEDHSDKDGFLYVFYDGESTFG